MTKKEYGLKFTGRNGKTAVRFFASWEKRATFLRTIGVSQLLGYVNPVPAGFGEGK